MATRQRRNKGGQVLELSLEAKLLYVSYLSSVLMVVQAALRELANHSEETRTYFEARPQPVLVVSVTETRERLKLCFTFADPATLNSIVDLSSSVFLAFMPRFIRLLKEQPQPGLWGPSVRSPKVREYSSELERRLDQVRIELRHFDRATLVYGGRRVRVEGERVEIEDLGRAMG